VCCVLCDVCCVCVVCCVLCSCFGRAYCVWRVCVVCFMLEMMYVVCCGVVSMWYVCCVVVSFLCVVLCVQLRDQCAEKDHQITRMELCFASDPHDEKSKRMHLRKKNAVLNLEMEQLREQQQRTQAELVEVCK